MSYFLEKLKQAEIIGEHQKKQGSFEIKNILLDTIVIDDLDENKPILDELVHIVDKINEPDIDV